MISFLLVAVLPSVALASPPVLRVSPREPVELVVVSPSGSIASGRVSELIREASVQFEEETDLFLRVVSPAQVAPCREPGSSATPLSCLVRAVRPDVDLQALESEADFPRFEAAISGADRAGLLVVLSATQIRDGPGDRVGALLVDLPVGLHLLRQVGLGADPIDTEGEIGSEAVLGQVPPRRLGPDETIATWVAEAFRMLQPALERTGHWRPGGRVYVRTDPGGATVSVDGRPVGAVGPLGVVLDGLRPGAHRVDLNAEGRRPETRTVEVERGEEVRLDVQLVRVGPSFGEEFRVGMFWTGVGVFAAGTGVLIHSFLLRSGDGTASPDGGDTFFKRYGTPTPEAPAGTGVMAAPLGYSLMGLGATWAVGSKLGEPDDFPWLSLVLSVVVGGAAYGLSEAFSPGARVD